MALANLGMGMSPNSILARSGQNTPSEPVAGGVQTKKAKTDKVKKEDKDVKDKAGEDEKGTAQDGPPLAKRSCAECRRLKAK